MHSTTRIAAALVIGAAMLIAVSIASADESGTFIDIQNFLIRHSTPSHAVVSIRLTVQA